MGGSKDASNLQYTQPNVWPSEVPDMEPAFKDLGQLICKVGQELAIHCDKFSTPPTFDRCLLQRLDANRNKKSTRTCRLTIRITSRA